MKRTTLNDAVAVGHGLTDGMLQAASNIRIVCESLKRQMKQNSKEQSAEAQLCFSTLEQSALWLTRAAENQQDVIENDEENLLPAFSMVHLGQQFQKAVAWVRENPAAKGKILIYEDNSTENDFVSADVRFADRVFLNLVSNALKFGQTIKVQLQKEERDLLLTVRDDGPGIPDAVMEHLFEPYVTDHLPCQQGGGVGLGLALTAKLCDRLSWKIQIETGKQGTCVSVHIPQGNAFSAGLDSPKSSLAFDAEQAQRVAQELSVLLL